MVTYAASKFLAPSSLDVSEEDIENIYNSIHDLKAVNKQTTTSEMQRMLDEHFFNLTTGSVDDNDNESSTTVTLKNDFNPTTDSIQTTEVTIERTLDKPESSSSDINETDETTDEALKKLLADL